MEVKRFQIIKALFELEISKGHMKWSVSEISRKTGLSRSLVYYYFGRNKKQILTGALQQIGEEFYGLSWERMQLAKQHFSESILVTRQLFEGFPEIVTFYMIWRNKDSSFAKVFHDLEWRYQIKLKELFPVLSQDEIQRLYIALHGIITAPFAKKENTLSSIQWVLNKK